MKQFTGPWAALFDYMIECGITKVFGLPDDDLGPLSALRESHLRMILCQNQRNAVFMGTGYALKSGEITVCFVGRGPAFANSLPGLLEAKASGAPLLLVAPSISGERKGTKAFQELEQIPLAERLVKWSYRIEHPDMLCWALEKAVFMSTSPPSGPVYLEFPDNLLDATIQKNKPWERPPNQRFLPDSISLEEAVQYLMNSKKPLFVAGGGLRAAKPNGVLEHLAETLGAGIFTTASGRGSVEESHPLFCGLTGLYAPPNTRQLFAETDLILSVGSRLEETATMGWEQVGSRVPLIQINVEADDFMLERAGPKLVGDAVVTIQELLALCRDRESRSATLVCNPVSESSQQAGTYPQSPVEAEMKFARDVGGWLEQVYERKRMDRDEVQTKLNVRRTDDRPSVAQVLDAVQRITPKQRILVQENGLQDMWSYFYSYYSSDLGGSIVPSEHTSLGFGAAAAAGVALATSDTEGHLGRERGKLEDEGSERQKIRRPVLALVGDGAFATFGFELDTVLEQRIPLIYLVLRNGGYGWLQYQLEANIYSESNAEKIFAFARQSNSPSSAIQHYKECSEQYMLKHPQLKTLEINAIDALEETIFEAYQYLESGRTVTVFINVGLDDIHPNIQTTNDP